MITQRDGEEVQTRGVTQLKSACWDTSHCNAAQKDWGKNRTRQERETARKRSWTVQINKMINQTVGLKKKNRNKMVIQLSTNQSLQASELPWDGPVCLSWPISSLKPLYFVLNIWQVFLSGIHWNTCSKFSPPMQGDVLLALKHQFTSCFCRNFHYDSAS